MNHVSELAENIFKREMAILQKQKTLSELKKKKADLEEKAATIKLQTEKAVVTDANLKNEAQRKIALHEKLNDNPDYLECVKAVKSTDDEIDALAFEIDEAATHYRHQKRMFDIEMANISRSQCYTTKTDPFTPSF